MYNSTGIELTDDTGPWYIHKPTYDIISLLNIQFDFFMSHWLESTFWFILPDLNYPSSNGIKLLWYMNVLQNVFAWWSIFHNLVVLNLKQKKILGSNFIAGIKKNLIFKRESFCQSIEYFFLVHTSKKM